MVFLLAGSTPAYFTISTRPYVLRDAKLLKIGTLIACQGVALPAGGVSHNLLPTIMLCRVHIHYSLFDLPGQG